MSPVRLEMPGGPVTFRHMVLNFTGTLSLDGRNDLPMMEVADV